MNHTAHPLADHLRSLSSAIANNWEYLEHTSQQLLFLKRARVTRSADAAFLRELDSMSRDLDAYKSTARELLDHSADMGTTINYIINFRNQGILASNAAQLHRIAEDNALETKAMAEIGQRTCTDSRTMRIATIIALIYLPANLVLTFFSTVFVDIQSPAGASTGTSNSTGQDGPQLRIYEQIWILFISMITLSVGTGSWFWIWNRTSPLAGVRSPG
ncbi:reverse transcriptase [Purpureocillium lavendulum]|uniref:Reverse transcriptase n=1 Tax=Purpureocillium lavendulum TaxID=1247861 RepID=A0AB34FL00_9HYPO|nr:reverse transcriptase [Purpureocillium lavendulum]